LMLLKIERNKRLDYDYNDNDNHEHFVILVLDRCSFPSVSNRLLPGIPVRGRR